MKKRLMIGLLTTLLMVTFAAGAFAAQRVVLVENFTNTGCPPCATANPITHSFMEAYPDQVVLNVQYHVNWPSATDPFYLANATDVNGRRTYYGVNAVPDMFTDGVDGPEPGSYSGLEAAVGSRLAVDAPFTFDITTSQVGDDLTVDVDVTAVDDVPASNLVLHMALIEPHIYTDPAGSDNGERNFYSTMRKMLPDYNGQVLTISNGNTVHFSQTATLDPAWVNIVAVVWVQDNSTKEILQAGSTSVVPDYAHYFGHPAPKAVGPLLTTQAFHAKILNLGTQGDTYDVTMTYDHPPLWGASVCIGESCLAPGTPYVAVPISAGGEQDLTIDITPIQDTGEGSLTMTVESQNDATYSWTETFTVIAAGTSVLLIDDDAGESYERYYQNAIAANGFDFGTWDLDGDGKVSSEILDQFSCVVWNVGWSFPSLDATDRAAIGSYLDGGGSLFITGQDIGWDFFDASGSQYGNAAWYRTYLGANYLNDNTNDLSITGIAGDPIGDGMAFTIIGGDGANNQSYPSQISPYGDSVACLEYSAGIDAGVRLDTGTYKTVYFSFGFEGISTAAARTSLMGNVLAWLGAGASPVGDAVPTQRLASRPIAAPNPFNPSTQIRFDVGGSSAADVQIDVYDLAGRKVRSLYRGSVQPGEQVFDWNGRSDQGEAVSSGLYLARIRVDEQTSNLKMMLAK